MKLNSLIPALFFVFGLATNTVAQKNIETFFFNAADDTVKTKAEARYYRVVQTSGRRRVTARYDSTDLKLEEMSFRKDKSQSGSGDSVWWRYGGFREWFPTGQLKVEGNFIYDRFHDELKTYYPNGVLKRKDVYYIDTLREGHCYAQDSSEITHFPYQENPEFIGGQAKMFQYLGNSVTYPKESREGGVEGTVYVGFVVSKTGDIENIKIKRGVSKLLDNESLRVVKAMAKWKPGKQDGEFVRVAYTLPIKFKLD
jgi:TonB family protein